MAALYIAPWQTWCDSTASTAVTTWGDWCDTSTNAATAASTAVWITWTTSGTATGNTAVTTYHPQPFVDNRSAEQKAADEARWVAERAEVARKAEIAAAERKAAIEKARALLLSMLSVKQREQYQRDRFFEVIGQHTRRRYRVRQGTHGNVRLLDDKGREVTSYCAQPSGVPDEDAMLAQALMLEHHEQDFLKVANARPA
jgi:hypothetical protein